MEVQSVLNPEKLAGYKNSNVISILNHANFPKGSKKFLRGSERVENDVTRTATTYFESRLSSLDDNTEPIRCQLVVTDRLEKSAVVVLIQSPILHHLQPPCNHHRHQSAALADDDDDERMNFNVA